MEPARTLTFGVELVPGSEPITGTLRAEGGERTTFTGWIELVAFLHEAIERGLTRSRGGANDEL